MIPKVISIFFMISLTFQGVVLCSIPGYPCYRTVEETYTAAQTLVTNYPELATWLDIGDSWEKSFLGGSPGYDLMVLVLTNELVAGPKPKLFVTAGLEARHYAAPELAMRLAEHLLQGYDTDADINWILDYHEIHFLFFANPDGRKHAETGLYWVKNTNENYCSPTSTNRGAALDRNFSFQWNCCGGSSGDPCNQAYRGPLSVSEPETQALQNYLGSIFDDQRNSNLLAAAPTDSTGVLIDLQAYGEIWLWPWGFTDTITPNGLAMQTMGRKLAFFNGFWPMQQVDLYPVDGDLNDFAYGDLGVISFTAKLGASFFQSCTTFEETLVPETFPALLYGAKVARAPYQMPSGPDIRDFSIPTNLLAFGSLLPISAVADDTRYSNSAGTEPTQNIAAAEFYIDTPPWSITPTPVPFFLTASDGSFDETVETVEATLDTSLLSLGKHIIFVRAMDADNNWGPVTAQFIEIVGLKNVITALQIVTGHTPEPIPLQADVDGDGKEGLAEAIHALQVTAGIVPYPWKPKPGTSWQWQLTGLIDTSLDVDMYNIDHETSPSIIDTLHAQEKTVICHMSVGSWEDYRSDANQYPASILGNTLNEWPNEKWVDIRRLDLLGPILEARMDVAAAKGCDGIEPDNVETYQNDSGFPLTYQDQITFNKWIAEKAHERRLSVGLKNDLDQVTDLEPYFDWALNEECFQYNECDALLPFVLADKAVFGVEYAGDPISFCSEANQRNFDWLKKNLELDAWRQACR